MPLSNKIIVNKPKQALIPYIKNTACFWEYPIFISLWCKCSLSAFKIPFIDLLLITLLIIAKKVSSIGIKNTMSGAIITMAVYVFATPNIEIIERQYPKKLDPISPIKVLAGFKLNGKNPEIPPAKAVISIIDISGDPFNTNTINKEKHDIKHIPDDNPSNPSIKLIALVIPTIHTIVIIVKSKLLPLNI